MSFDLANSIAILERTPAVLRELLGDLPTAWTAPNVGPDTWSPFDVVGHLIDGEETDWMPRARMILVQGELLNRFAELRQRNLAELEALKLGPDELRLQGEHPELGPVTQAHRQTPPGRPGGGAHSQKLLYLPWERWRLAGSCFLFRLLPSASARRRAGETPALPGRRKTGSSRFRAWQRNCARNPLDAP